MHPATIAWLRCHLVYVLRVNTTGSWGEALSSLFAKLQHMHIQHQSGYYSFTSSYTGALPCDAYFLLKEEERTVYAVRLFNRAVRHDWCEVLDRLKAS